jgi:hypothetical protein
MRLSYLVEQRTGQFLVYSVPMPDRVSAIG